MSISFTINHEQGYFISKYVGKLTDNELIESWKNFLEGDDWVPGLNELADLSEMDATMVTMDGINRLMRYVGSIYEKHGLNTIIVGVYAPRDLPFGLARMYEFIANESPEEICVFRTMQEAESWVNKIEL